MVIVSDYIDASDSMALLTMACFDADISGGICPDVCRANNFRSVRVGGLIPYAIMNVMSLEIWPFEGDVVVDNANAKGYAKVHVRRNEQGKYAEVPEGANACVRISGVRYFIRNFRGRPGHTAGAVVEGDGVRIELDGKNSANAINLNIFRYRK